MTIYTYSNFKKKPNSTKQPTSGTTVTCTLKEATSIENPTFILAGALSSYSNITAVQWDSRYYFVTDIVSKHNGITEISCSIDRLATFKTDIGSTTAFIERCATGYDGSIRDDRIITTDKTYSYTDLTGGALTPSSLGTGVIALTLANISPSQATGGTSQIVYFDAAGGTYGISQLMNALYDNSVISAIEKILNKPYDAILSVRYLPGFTTSDLLTLTTLFSSSNILYFGDHAYSGTINTVKTIGTGPWIYTNTFEFSLQNARKYTTYNWRNFEPFATWSIFLPFYGNVSIPVQEYLGRPGTNYANLVIKATIDLTTGELVYSRYRKEYSTGTPVSYLMQEYRTTIGVEVPIQGGNRDMLSFTSDIVAGVGSVALMVASGGSMAGAVAAGAASGTRAVMDVAQQNISTVGTFNAHGTQIATAENTNIQLTVIGFETQTDPSNYAAAIGAPFMKSDTISNHSGYIKCSNAAVSIAGTQADKDAVNSMLNSGIFYE